MVKDNSAVAETEQKAIVIEPPKLSEAIQSAAQAVVERAKSLTIKTRADLEGPANEALVAVAKQAKALEKERKDMKEPSLEAGRRVDALFKPTIAELDEATRIIKNAMVTAKQKFDKEDREKEERIMARAEKEGQGSLKEETAINKVSEIDRVQKTTHVAGGSSTFKKVKQVTVTDINAIPVDYLRPKTAEELKDFKPWPSIQKAALALYDMIEAGHPGVQQIPGVKVELVDSLAVR